MSSLPSRRRQREILDALAHTDLVDRLEQHDQIGLVDHRDLILAPQLGLLLLIRFGGRLVDELDQALGRRPMEALGHPLHRRPAPQRVLDRGRVPVGDHRLHLAAVVERAHVHLRHRIELDLDADAGQIGLQLLRDHVVGRAGDDAVAVDHLELEAVGEAGLRQRLLRALEILPEADLLGELLGRAQRADRNEVRRPRRRTAEQRIDDAVVVDRVGDRLARVLVGQRLVELGVVTERHDRRSRG